MFEDESITALSGTNIIQSDEELSLNYFLSDDSILEKVEPGKIYITEKTAESLGFEIGDKITIEVEGVKNEFTYAGGFKDAVLGTSSSLQRYIINRNDFNKYIESSEIEKYYGGKIIHIQTNDMENMLKDINPIIDSSIFKADRAYVEFCYVFDMIITGIILVISVILIAIAFVILRFTITFTLTEEFREIGVMKTIGITNLKIRGLYLIKYAGLSILGAIIGLILSFPFGNLLMSVTSKSIIINNQNPIFINLVCAVIVVGVILLFCFSCTKKVKKMKPIDAIRNGETGERFGKKSFMKLGKSKISPTAFLALNDIVISPKRFSIITIVFSLCMLLLFILSVTVSTFESGTLNSAFAMVDSDVFVEVDVQEFLLEDGQENLKKSLKDFEKELKEIGMPAKCMKEIIFSLPVIFNGNKANLYAQQGVGTTMDMYEYLEGTAPQNNDEIAITKISANKIKATIGDTLTIQTINGDKKYIITAFYQSMYTNGDGIRFYSDEELNYVQAVSYVDTQIKFTDNPNKEEIEYRIEKIKEIYPEFQKVRTSKDAIAEFLGVTEAMKAMKILIAAITIVLVALITVLMERTFISKEQGEIALEKLKDENRDAYLQANFIKTSTGLPCYKNTKVSYYKIGEDFHKELLESLKEAKKFIFMEYFIIEEGKMWNTQSKTQLNVEEFIKIEYKELDTAGVVAPYGDGPEDFYEDDVAKYVYLNMINSAKEYIYITTPYLICDYEILNSLCVCAKKGVDVRIIVPHIPDKETVFWMTQSNYEILIKSGVKIYEYTPGFIHAKQFICDDIFATCGTVNLDYRSLVHHFECGTWMYKTECIENMKKDFIDTINVSVEIKDAKNRLASWKKLIVEVMKVFFPLF